MLRFVKVKRAPDTRAPALTLLPDKRNKEHAELQNQQRGPRLEIQNTHVAFGLIEHDMPPCSFVRFSFR